MSAAYYAGRTDSLRDIFGAARVEVVDEAIVVDGRRYPVIDDVIVLLDEARWPASLLERTGRRRAEDSANTAFAPDIQFSFGEEWTTYADILTEHDQEFAAYFDLVDMESIAATRVCDFGCGIGRWSWFIAPKCREIVLVDFSEAIFVARRNLAAASNALFLMGDVMALPFRPGFAGFGFSLGVLHHLPVDALDATRALAPFTPRLLIYLYYALDNRPAYFRALLAGVTGVRLALARMHSPRVRRGVAAALAAGVYMPLVALGHLGRPFGLQRYVPLYEAYAGKSFARIEQDAYDRFFTRIEQRVSRKQIQELRDTFARITVSDRQPFWHFLCER